MNDYQAQPSQLPQHYNIQTATFLTEVIIIALRQERDVVLALLVKAAINVKTSATHEDSVPVSDFLERALNTFMGVGDKEGRAFL
jgi:hypothetical protein